MMIVAVTDANIFIDVIKLGMLDHFFKLNLAIVTTQEVMDQLMEAQVAALVPYVQKGHLEIHKFSSEELQEIQDAEMPRALEFADKAVIHLAAKLQVGVLTGDGAVRKFCLAQKISVHGILWVFDLALELNVCETAYAHERLTYLLTFNDRLPKDECIERLEKWKWE